MNGFEFTPYFFVVAVLALMGVGIWWSHIQAKKRREALAAKAGSLGLEYFELLPQADHRHFGNFKLAQTGHSRKAYNAIIADSGELRMVFFDYVFSTGGGKNKSTHRQTVAMVFTTNLRLPEFALRPEGFLSRFAQFFGNDIDFDDDPAFSDGFVLEGPNETAIRAYFTPARRASMVALGSLCVQAVGSTFIYYRPRRVMPVDSYDQIMKEAFDVFGVLQDIED